MELMREILLSIPIGHPVKAGIIRMLKPGLRDNHFQLHTALVVLIATELTPI